MVVERKVDGKIRRYKNGCRKLVIRWENTPQGEERFFIPQKSFFGYTILKVIYLLNIYSYITEPSHNVRAVVLKSSIA
jgi:hypothetical protein